MNEIQSLSRLCAAVEKANADIAPGYAEYVQLAFAIATDCGEAGRNAFHRLCNLSSKYDQRHADRIFTNAIAKGRGDVHLGTAFRLAEQKGIHVPYEEGGVNRPKNAEMQMHPATNSHTGARAYNKESEEIADESEELQEGSDPLQQLPFFPAAQWPQFLSRIISYGDTPTQRDVMLLGALTALGSGMERHVRCFYSGKQQSPCQQSFIVAPSASGKGILSFIRLLVEPIHDEIRDQVAEAYKVYRQEKAAYDTLGKKRNQVEAPQPPQNKMFLISGNTTGTGILENIMDANGTGLICETEADTLSAAIGSEYGHWSDTLRKAFDHDRLSYNRRTDKEFREIKKCYLSVLLSGTPAQVKPLIPSAENGLFSRQLFYYMHGISTWVNQFATDNIDLEAVFTNLGLEWKKKIDLFKSHGIHTLQLTKQQQDAFNALFAELFERAGVANDNEMSSSIARLAVNTCRILAEVAMLRALEADDPYAYKDVADPLLTPDPDIAAENITDGIISRWKLIILPADFEAVLGLVIPLYCHATHILSFLPSTEVRHRTNADRDALFSKLGEEFTRIRLREEAESMHINPNTALSWLARLLKKGVFTPTDIIGTYARTHTCEN